MVNVTGPEKATKLRIFSVAAGGNPRALIVEIVITLGPGGRKLMTDAYRGRGCACLRRWLCSVPCAAQNVPSRLSCRKPSTVPKQSGDVASSGAAASRAA